MRDVATKNVTKKIGRIAAESQVGLPGKTLLSATPQGGRSTGQLFS